MDDVLRNPFVSRSIHRAAGIDAPGSWRDEFGHAHCPRCGEFSGRVFAGMGPLCTCEPGAVEVEPERAGPRLMAGQVLIASPSARRIPDRFTFRRSAR